MMGAPDCIRGNIFSLADVMYFSIQHLEEPDNIILNQNNRRIKNLFQKKYLSVFPGQIVLHQASIPALLDPCELM